jgi:hypothetical protein
LAVVRTDVSEEYVAIFQISLKMEAIYSDASVLTRLMRYNIPEYIPRIWRGIWRVAVGAESRHYYDVLMDS